MAFEVFLIGSLQMHNWIITYVGILLLQQAKKIELNIPSEIVPRKELEAHTITYIREEPLDNDKKTTPDTLLTEASAPPGNESNKEKSGGLEASNEKFISNEELKANRKTEKGLSSVW